MNLKQTIWAYNWCVDYHNNDLKVLTWQQIKACEDKYGKVVKEKLPGVLMPEEADFFYADKDEDQALHIIEWAEYVFSIVQCTHGSQKPLCKKYFPLDKTPPGNVN